MSRNRRTKESSNDDQTAEDSDGILHQTADAKRGKLPSFSDTTLQDLPHEMLELIFAKAVAQEVRDMKLAKGAWKEKANIVIDRLCAVCSHWNTILTTNVFRKRVHQLLDETTQEPIRLEMLHRCQFQYCVYEVTTIKDEIFLLCQPNYRWIGVDYVINVFDRKDKTLQVKDIIPIPSHLNPWNLRSSSASNCLYLLSQAMHLDWCKSVLRITRDSHPYDISTWITDLWLSIPMLSVSENGNLAIASRRYGEETLHAVSVYSANGFLQHELMFYVEGCEYSKLQSFLYRPNGNLIFVCCIGGQGVETGATQVTEIDVRGRIVNRYRSALVYKSDAHFADVFGRIWIIDYRNRIEVVDSELNLLDFAGPQSDDNNLYVDTPLAASFNFDRNEVVRATNSWSDKKAKLTIFRFTEN